MYIDQGVYCQFPGKFLPDLGHVVGVTIKPTPVLDTPFRPTSCSTVLAFPDSYNQ